MAKNSNDTPELEGPEDPANEQPLVSHLIELRNRTVRACLSIIVVFAGLSPFMKEIFDYLSKPLMVALPQGVKLLATGVVAPFMVPLKVTLFVAFVIALPYVLYQLWAYIAQNAEGISKTLHNYLQARTAYTAHGALWRVYLFGEEEIYSDFVKEAKRIIYAASSLLCHDRETYGVHVRCAVWSCAHVFVIWKMIVKCSSLLSR